jgi:sulfur relay (sulfurtransferase) complex TusBCD TusD component (DsrE family)
MITGIVIYSKDPETVWNAFRFANYALAAGDSVKVFLIGSGVELETVGADKFNVAEQSKTFLATGGKMFACGTCLEIHKVKPSQLFAVATLKDLYEIVNKSDKILTF